MIFSLLIAIPLGIFAATKPNSKRDYISGGISMLMMATPNFFVGLVFIYFFAIVFKILPSGGMYSSAGGAKTFADLAKHMIMPCMVLSFQQIGNWVRHMRSGMLEVMQEDYIRTARSKGLKQKMVIIKHGLKNALIPVITIIGMSIPSLVGGAVVTEQVFGWPGVGSLMVTAIEARDYPVIMGVTVMIAVAVLLANILTDLAYGLVDPRISYK
jgi:peptide/nickel transport system permease protein